MTRLFDFFGAEPRVERQPNALTVSAERSLGSLMSAIESTRPDWVVVRRRHEFTGEHFVYAFRVEEIRDIAGEPGAHWQVALVDGLGLHEWGSSLQARGDRVVTEDTYNRQGPAAERVVEFDSTGSVVALAYPAEPDVASPQLDLPGSDFPVEADFDLEDAGAPEGDLGPVAPMPSVDDLDFDLEFPRHDGGAMEESAPSAEPSYEDAAEEPMEETAAPEEEGSPAEPELSFEEFDLDREFGVGDASPAEEHRPQPSFAPREPADAPAAPEEDDIIPGAFEIDFGATGTPQDDDTDGDLLVLGAPRGAGDAEAASPATVDMTLSANAPAELEVGTEATILYLLERSAVARPLIHAIRTAARTDRSITVMLAMHGPALELIGQSIHVVDPPSADQPRSGFFRVRGREAGAARMELAFLQEGSQLGVIGLEMEVVEDEASTVAAPRRVPARPPRVADAGTLLLRISERMTGDEFRYEYFLYGPKLGVVENFLSEPLRDAGGGRARTEIDFVRRIYERVTPELRSSADLRQLTSDLRRIGQMLSRELFPDDAIRRLWPMRDRIEVIQVVSFEPYVPWELVRLEHPDSQEVDDRFLAEYGLVRSSAGVEAAQTLELGDWCWMAANFPMGSLAAVGSETDFFTGPDPALVNPQIRLDSIEPTVDALLETLSRGEFDVLHLACHAESDHDAIEGARLIIGDRPGPEGAATRLGVDTVSIQAEARLKARRPLVFLNACETGREGVVLTSWGGWPKVFMERGAGAFVGSSWPVYDRPAAAFARQFYRVLLNGESLARAAREARNAAKGFGDASWLAFKIYGDPAAHCPVPPFDPFA
ncbi:CHAT domain-containing protein [Tropicimonas sp. IMCC6043]|uniref:CHAT domain-containing protein n=1 Tax=Tropicimonas sp. IMCC6043 TaxID=2510645 RepID=UPI00101C7A6D|nr:CHAT domain-containing protein [Tropicimonas sp. IMCC6043]RYH09192.1 CHAT domain-containing protein [Tropicimonas sp. IMCC6043]